MPTILKEINITKIVIFVETAGAQPQGTLAEIFQLVLQSKPKAVAAFRSVGHLRKVGPTIPSRS
jgi:hypothetical protein